MQTKLIAENHIQISRSLFTEGMRAVEGKSYQKKVKKLAGVLLVLYLAVAAWLLYTGGSLVFLIGESVFLGALLFWLMVMLPGSRRRSKYKAMAQGAVGEPERTVRFYDGQLSVTDAAGKETVIPYAEVEGLLETRRLYVLRCRDRRCVLLDKEGFVQGDFAAVTAAAEFSRISGEE